MFFRRRNSRETKEPIILPLAPEQGERWLEAFKSIGALDGSVCYEILSPDGDRSTLIISGMSTAVADHAASLTHPNSVVMPVDQDFTGPR